MFLHHYTLCEVRGRQAGCSLLVSVPAKLVAQTPLGFALDLPRRQGDDEARGRASCAGLLPTATVPSAGRRPAAVPLACQPDSGHPGQSKSTEVRLAEFVRRCPLSPGVSCQAAFDFHPASSSHALRSGRVTGKIPKGVVTPPFCANNCTVRTHAKPSESRMLKALAVFLGRCETCFAVLPKSWGAL